MTPWEMAAAIFLRDLSDDDDGGFRRLGGDGAADPNGIVVPRGQSGGGFG